MVSAYNTQPPSAATATPNVLNKGDEQQYGPSTAPNTDESTESMPSFDLLDRIKGMYRLLDLISEQSSNGLGERIPTKIIFVNMDLYSGKGCHSPGFDCQLRQ